MVSLLGASANLGAKIGVAATQLAQVQSAGRSDPQVEAAVQETVSVAQSSHLADPSGKIAEVMADPTLTQAQKDEYLARIVDLASGSDTVTTAAFGRIDKQASDKLAQSLETIGEAWTNPATPELRQQVTAAMGRIVDSGRVTAHQLSDIMDPARIGSSDGFRELLTSVTDGTTLQQLSTNLLYMARRYGYDAETQAGVNGLQAITAAADIAGMAAAHGYTGSANSVVVELAKNPGIVENAGRLDSNTLDGPDRGRGAFDAFASALNGAKSNMNIVDDMDTVFSQLVQQAGKDEAFNRTEGLNDLGDYFNRNIERLNEETVWEGTSDETDGKYETYEGLTERFIRNVMLNEEFTNAAPTQQAIETEMARLANLAGSEGTVGEDVRAQAARELGNIVGSLQGAGNDLVADDKVSSDAQIKGLRSITDIFTSKLFSKGGPLAQLFGGALVDNFWKNVGDAAQAAARGDVNAVIGALNDMADAFGDGMIEALRENFPIGASDVDSGAIRDAYEQAVTEARTNPPA
jgi:hypothetical protein